ncbi:MAG: aminotransferase class I/II-fold pyridoxal phosphate-dependent enzyme [Ruminococcus sp.]|nr:aminotransferase class I/II-fold pyridoxal phosphate-dependent enzyme [Ruminococcus sp.]
MQAVILAAGMGSRLGKYTQHSTKCMIKVNEETLLERIFDSLRSAGISKAVLVTGYCSENLMSHAVEAAGSDIEITFIHNKKYNTTNNIYSLYLASSYMEEDDTILFESDLIFDETIVKDMVCCEDSDLVAVSKFERWMDGTVTTFDEKRNVTAFIDKSSFKWDNCERYYKTVNIYKLSKEFFSGWYKPFLEAYIKTCGNNVYYEMVLKVITNICTTKLKVFDVTGKKWYEIDTPQDLQTAETLFKKEGQLEEYQNRYGGYWRFDNLKDYCYLVNPWFPPENMQNEIIHSFGPLLSQYPSGQRVIRTAMASLLECSEEYICAGNGAAELIRILCSEISGRCFIAMPSFNEYLNSLKNAEIVSYDTYSDNFRYGADTVIEQSRDCDTVIIINPDNPSGNFIGYEDMEKIINACRERKQRLIVDESFADFADPEIRYTLINDDVLESNPNLVVIKSISKSYGVPGIRLGALCCANKELVGRINALLPIWNINSFGEYFLQIFPKYKNEYTEACKRVSTERRRFSTRLRETGMFEVYPSQANFIMCRLKNGSSLQLTQLLLEKDFLIKDLKTKTGCHNDDIVRVAVKEPKDNDMLIEMLRIVDFKGER